MTTTARVADYEREDMLYKEQARLVAELAEARAQIARFEGALDRGGYIDLIADLNRQLAEARAQIREAKLAFNAAYDEGWSDATDNAQAQIDQQAALLDACGSQITSLEARIVAKDAALREAAVFFEMEDNAAMLAIIDTALSTPAGGTAPDPQHEQEKANKAHAQRRVNPK